MANRFPAIVPTHLYSSRGWKVKVKDPFHGLINILEPFRFPLHPVDEAGTKGLFLIIDDNFPDLPPESYVDFLEDTFYVFFEKIPNIRAPEDGKLLVTLKIVDQSQHYVENLSETTIKVVTIPRCD